MEMQEQIARYLVFSNMLEMTENHDLNPHPCPTPPPLITPPKHHPPPPSMFSVCSFTNFHFMWQINGTEKVFDFEELVNENHA